MARLIQAVAKFGPKVDLGKRVELKELWDAEHPEDPMELPRVRVV